MSFSAGKGNQQLEVRVQFCFAHKKRQKKITIGSETQENEKRRLFQEVSVNGTQWIADRT